MKSPELSSLGLPKKKKQDLVILARGTKPKPELIRAGAMADQVDELGGRRDRIVSDEFKQKRHRKSNMAR